MLQPEYRKFSVDPQITSFEVLQSIIAKAFDLKGYTKFYFVPTCILKIHFIQNLIIYFFVKSYFCSEFTVSYRAIDDYGQETYLSLLSDWDLDAAFLR